jgi:uncharacterized membrane protein
MVVGIMLVSYGTFWTGEGLRVHWPGGDAMLVGLVGIFAVAATVTVRVMAAGNEGIKEGPW